MFFGRKKKRDPENTQHQGNDITAAADGKNAEQSARKRAFRVNNCRFTSRQCVELQKKRDSFLFGGNWITFYELPLSLEERIDDETSRMRDGEDGGLVLALYEDVPIFDSGDAMYDSAHKAYIKRVGEELNALYIGNGYQLSEANLYLGVRPENEEAAGILRDAGLSE